MIADLCTVTDVAVSGYERSNVKFAGPESEERGLRFLSLFNIITFLQWINLPARCNRKRNMCYGTFLSVCLSIRLSQLCIVSRLSIWPRYADLVTYYFANSGGCNRS